MKDDDLKQLAAALDKGQAGLIVLYATNMADQVAASITPEIRFVSHEIDRSPRGRKQLMAAEATEDRRQGRVSGHRFVHAAMSGTRSASSVDCAESR